MLYEYRGALYPDYLKHGNACRFIAPAALEFCQGEGYDIGAGPWPLPGAVPIDIANGNREHAMSLPAKLVDFIFSSHMLEHLENPVAALEHWKSRLRSGGVLFLYLPHREMTYWLPQNNRKHLHTWRPEEMQTLIEDIGFIRCIRSERDLYWSFAVVGFKP